jgi:ubiquinone/menaquinone biosynthesis C-methylase UbiE
LSYPQNFIDDAPKTLLASFCGVGNPFSARELQPGEKVLDVGSGAGFDLYVASRFVGPSGKVCGIDLTREMVVRAQKNLLCSGRGNIEVVHISTEKIPYDDNTFDTVISNGVINLSPCKQELFLEIFRVMKKRGTFQFADVILEKKLPDTMTGSLEAWSQ